MFVDGLRFDVARTLQERLDASGFRVQAEHRLSPLPTVTATARPFATPVHEALRGTETGEGFCPVVQRTGQEATVLRLRDEMRAQGVDVLEDDPRALDTEKSSGWFEAGRFDELGHKLGIHLAANIETEVSHLVDQVAQLLDFGWSRVRIVTDHGWLLMPGGLPKVDLPSYMVQTKWARCACVRGESAVTLPVYAWHWNGHVRIASPPGVACFIAGTEYTHGGVSPQECVVPELVVERRAKAVTATITTVSWRGMRCRVSVATSDPMVVADLRLHWKQAATSLVAAPKAVGPAGEVSLAVEDDSNEGVTAMVVLVDESGNVLDRRPTTVGEAP